MARRNIDAAQRFAFANGEGENRRRRVAIAKQGSQAICRKNLRDGQRELTSEKAAVVSDNHLGLATMNFGVRIFPLGIEIIGHRLGDNADIFEVKSRAIRERQPAVPNRIVGVFKMPALRPIIARQCFQSNAPFFTA